MQCGGLFWYANIHIRPEKAKLFFKSAVLFFRQMEKSMCLCNFSTICFLRYIYYVMS